MEEVPAGGTRGYGSTGQTLASQYPGCVHVGMECVTAEAATETGLGGTVALVEVAASRAFLARVGGSPVLDLDPVALGDIQELGFNHPLADESNQPAQATREPLLCLRLVLEALAQRFQDEPGGLPPGHQGIQHPVDFGLHETAQPLYQPIVTRRTDPEAMLLAVSGEPLNLPVETFQPRQPVAAQQVTFVGAEQGDETEVQGYRAAEAWWMEWFIRRQQPRRLAGAGFRVNRYPWCRERSVVAP